jgi:hypothetical protein
VRDDFLAGDTPMTIPQRLEAIERRQVSQGTDIAEIKDTLKVLVPEVQTLRAWARWSKIGLKAAPIVLTAAAAQFPAAKAFILAMLNAITVAQ